MLLLVNASHANKGLSKFPSSIVYLAFLLTCDYIRHTQHLYLPQKAPSSWCSGKQYRVGATARLFGPQSLARSPPSSFELHNSSRISPSMRALRTSRECWCEEKDLRACGRTRVLRGAQRRDQAVDLRCSASSPTRMAIVRRVGATLLQ